MNNILRFAAVKNGLCVVIVTAALLGKIQSAYADVLTTKEAFDGLTGNPVTSVELGQTVEYGFNWSCNFTSTPPPGECGDFVLTDPLPAGVTFVSCAVPGLYTCSEAGGVVTIEALDPARLFTNGESATASVIVQLSTDASDFPGGVPGPLTNTATTTSADGPEDVVSEVDINEPANNWEVSKSVIIPTAPLQPALDSDVTYEIEICPNGPAGLGTGTVIIDNPTLTDVCPAGATVSGATLNGASITPTGACPNVDIPLPATFDPADGCQVIELTLQYPSGAGSPPFADGVDVTNAAVLDGDNIDAASCPNSCQDDVTSTLAPANPDAEIDKTAKRDDVAPGAFNRYDIRFDTSSSNVLQTGMVIEDAFPIADGMEPISLRHGGWSDSSVTADVIILGTPGGTIISGYDGTSPPGINHSFAAGETGFRIVFTSPVPPGFDGGQFSVNFRADAGLLTGDSFENCALVSSDQILPADNPESCVTVDVIDPTSDLSLNKQMPDGVSPGGTFTTLFDIVHDDTSSASAVNPVVTDCLPNELEFVSWDGVTYSGLDDPNDPIDTVNSNPLGVEPNLEVIAPGAAGNTCADPTQTLIRWSWKAAAPSGSIQLDGSPGVANPFDFPIRRDRIAPRDNIADATGELGLFVRIRMEATLRVKPGVPQQNGLTNTVQVVPENSNFRCLFNFDGDDNDDIDGDGTTGAADPVCSRDEDYRVLSSAAFGGNKFVEGFPSLPNFDPDNPPADNTPGASTGIVTPASCPTDADGRTRTPCVAQAMRGQPFNYRIRLSNDGNVLLTDYVAYDILPHTDSAGSDTGIGEAQSGVVRGSTWVPLLNGPVVVSSANPTVAAELAANGVIEYSASTNPCRPELSINNDTLGGDWQAGACDDDWTAIPLADSTTFPDGYASVRAWRLIVPFAAGWTLADPDNQDFEDIVVDIEMLADPTAPGSDYEAVPPELEIAWNNVAFRATNVATGRRLLAAEAIKTGIVMPPDFPLESTGLRIGNLVWVDQNNDGIAQDGEQGIFDVTVQLWNDLTGDGPSADDTLFDTVQTDAAGHYLFDDADPLNRDNLGIPVGNYYVVIPEAQTGSFVLDENYSSTTDEPNADGNVDNDDNGASDNSGTAVTTTDPASPDIEGVFSGTVNLALTEEPVDEQLRGDDATDDDNDFFDDNDSNVSVDFGFYQLRLGNHVWLDNNNDGIADATEPALENTQVQLFLDNGDGVFDPDTDTPLDNDTTDAQGQYLFEGLDVGNYFVAIPSSQTGLNADGTTFTTDQLASSTPSSATGAVALANDNDDDGAAGAFGSVTSVDYASVSPLLELTVAGAQTSESDTSLNGVNGGSATDPSDPNAEFNVNLTNMMAFPDTNSYLTADFGFAPAVSLGSTIWTDLNGDGTQDVGEGAIAGATVTLLDASGAVINDAAGNPITAVTDVNGQYNFNQLPPGTYRVAVDLSTSTVPNIGNFFPTPVQVATPDDDSNTDSNIDFAADPTPTDLVHISGPITLVAGAEPTGETDPINAAGTGAATDPDQPNQTDLPDNSGNMTLDMGFVPPVSIGSTLWIDDNEDGLQTAGETPIEAATVTLLNADGTVFDSDPYTAGDQVLTVLTDGDGQYNFDGLPPGDYRVRADLSTASNGNAAALIPTPLQVADPDAAGAGQDNNTDSNIDSAFDTVTTDQIHTSGVITLLPTTEPVGETDPIGAGGPDQPNQGLVPADDPDSNGNMTVDFGFIEPVSLGSVIWFDSNANGLQDDAELPIQGAVVTLLNGTGAVYDSNPNTPAIDALTVTTGPTGEYNFNDLPEGDYIVQVSMAGVAGAASIQPTPTQVADANAVSNNADSNIATVTDPAGTPGVTADDLYLSGVVNLTVGAEPTGEQDAIDANPTGGLADDQPNQNTALPNPTQPDANGNMTVDFGFIQPVSLGSTIWEDLNGDGNQDTGEPAIAGATVTLLDAAGVPIAGVSPVLTNADGEYNFDDLPPGDYRVRVDLSSVAGGADLSPSPVQVADPDIPADPSENSNDDSNIDFAFDTTAGNSTTDQIHTSGVITLIPGTEPTGETDSIGTPGPDQPNQDLAGMDPDSSGNMTVDMGFVRPVSLGSTIWQDENANGMQDDGEPTIVNATVTLLDDTGAPVDSDPYTAGVQTITTTTDSEGQYFFNDLPPGDYRVQVDLSTVAAGGALIPSPVQVADPDAAGDVNDDSNIDVAFDPILTDQIHTSGIITLTSGGEPTGETDPIDLVDGNGPVDDQPGQTGLPDDSGNMTLDMGFYAPVSIGSFVWQDNNADGLQDANEPPLAGATVTLLVETAPGVFGPATQVGGAAVTPITVGPDGLYEFTNLLPGTYKVQVTPPADFFPSPVQNAADDDDTANDSNIADEPSPGVFESGAFIVTSGGEPIEAGPDSNRGDNQDGAPGSAEDTSGNMTIDFGFVPPASLGNYVWLDLDMDGVQDANEDGIANVTVNLFEDTDGDGVISGAELTTPVATATTGPNGEYLFPDLEPGVVYQTGVDVTTLPAGLVQTFDEGDGLGATDSLSDPIILDPNEFHETADFGYAPPAGLGAIGDTIWIDADDDGVQDPGEPGIAGVTVTLTPAPGVDLGAGPGVPISTVTDGNGKYLFPNLPLEQAYVVDVDITTLPPGYVSGPSNLGDPDVRDGNSSVADNSTIVVLTPADPINLDADFGYLPPADQNNSIGDTLWIDVDEDGNGPAGAGDGSDTTELPLPGVTVSLVQDNGDGVFNPADDTVFATTITDANGMYLFTGIPDGDYIVLVTDQNNVLAGLDPTADGDDPANPGAFVPVTPNASFVDDLGVGVATPVADLDQDFGYVDSNTAGGDGSIGDTIFFDADGSGAPDAGEGLEGVVVELFGPGPDGVIGGGDDVLIATTTTDANGNYLFTGLDTSDTGPNPGTDYQVVVDIATLPNGGTGWSNSVDPDTSGTGDSESVTTLTTADPVDLDQDFGYVADGVGNSISGTIWPDTDGDGMQAEPGGFGGVTVVLTDENGNIIATTVTDSDGNYEFTGLPDGIYTVIVTDDDNVLNGFEHTDSPNGGSDTGDETSKDDTGYTVDLDSAGVVDTPVSDETGDFGYEPSVTNPISLGSFLASSVGDQVRIEWATQTEVANLGFHLYAQVDGEWTQLNDQLILSQGDSVSVQSYSATFEVEATMFAISDIDLTGKETMHGPYSLGKAFGVVSDRQVIDWQAEKAEREAKQARRDAERLEQQKRRMRSLQQTKRVGGVE